MIQNDWKDVCDFFYERDFSKPSLRLNYFSLLAESGSFKLGLRSLTGQVEGEERERRYALWLNVLEQTCKIKWRLSDSLNICSFMHRNIYRENTQKNYCSSGLHSSIRYDELLGALMIKNINNLKTESFNWPILLIIVTYSSLGINRQKYLDR